MLPVAFLTMRRSSIVTSLLVLTLSALSSPVQQAQPEPNSIPLRDSGNAFDASTHSMTLVERDTYNCTDLQASFDSRCWQELGLSGYMMDPNTGWNHTIRICSQVQSAENNDGSDCCKVGEPWTTCYLRLAHGTPGQDCSQINSQFCAYQSDLSPSLDPNVKPQVQYIMKNIYGESTLPLINVAN